MTLEKEAVYSRDIIKLYLNVDNSNCQVPVEKFQAALVRNFHIKQLPVGKKKAGKVIKLKPLVISSEEYTTNCKAGGQEDRIVELWQPEMMFPNEDEKIKYPAMPIETKHLQIGQVATIDTELYKVFYEVHLSVKHQGHQNPI